METAETIEAAGIEFCARQRGDHPQTVFLHGFGGDLLTWDRLWAALGEDFPGLRYDLRGFGRTIDRGSEPYSHTDDLLAILDSRQIDRCIPVGVSMGGAIALNFALSHPGRVAKLVLISPALVAWEWSEDWKNLWRPIIGRARAGAMDEARELWWRHPLFTTTRHSPAARDLRDAIGRFSGSQWVSDREKPALPDIDRLHRLAVDTLLLTGERDVEDFRVIADAIASSVTHLTRIDVPGRGHLLHMEDPDACARHIRRFISNA